MRNLSAMEFISYLNKIKDTEEVVQKKGNLSF